MNRRFGWIAIVTGLVAVCVISTNMNWAQSGGGGRSSVATVDLVQVFNEYELSKTVNQKIQQMNASIEQELKQRLKEIEAEQAALDAFSPDSKEFFQRISKINKMEAEFQAYKAFQEAEIRRNHARWFLRTYDKVKEEIAEVAEKHGVQVVLSREDVQLPLLEPNAMRERILDRKVLYASSSLDLSDAVLTSLNKKFEASGGAAKIKFNEP